MSSTFTPFLSNSYFIQSRACEYKIALRLSRGAKCVLSGECSTWRDKWKMWCVAFHVKVLDLTWEHTENQYLQCFVLWKRGEEILEEFIADNPDAYWTLETQDAIENRKITQKKLIVLGEMMLAFPFGRNSNGQVVNPFINSERINSVIRLLRDDLEDRAEAYFQPLSDSEEHNERQRRLAFTQVPA